MNTPTEPRGRTVTGPEPPAPLSQQETIEDLLERSGRGFVPIRKSFVQQGRGKQTKAGPLASFVTAHDERGLDTYLLGHAIASADPWRCDYPSDMWVRALDLSATATPAAARGAVSKIMRRLEERKLIVRRRAGRLVSFKLLQEDGSGEPYRHPLETSENWLRLPYAYWLDGFYVKLGLPAKAMLLVALSLPDGFYLPAERTKDWYGLSADSAERGLRELRSNDVLTYSRQWRKEQRSKTGWIEQRTYTLCGPFSSAAREAAATHRPGRRRKAAPQEMPTEETE
jgi:hypothetical protein